jgi:3-phenylpropionate/trans-cinnamate dioxygenase ferredoxin reductase subunit
MNCFEEKMNAAQKQLIVVGAGQAGSELALSARLQGWIGPILLLGDESDLPYQRPSLSKAYLCGKVDMTALSLRQASAYDSAGILLRTGVRMRSINKQNRTIELENGEVLAYDKLALCTGGRARPWLCEGMNPDSPPHNLLSLRTREDADAIRHAIKPGTRLTVVGGGYIGLEVAASARSLSAEVTVLESQPRILARVAGQPMSEFIAGAHQAAGVDIKTNVAIKRVVVEAGHITQVELMDGTVLPTDVVVAGIGMLPNVEPFMAAGLATAEGIAVDACSVTSDSDVVAAGDCTIQQIPHYDRLIRLESVPNALEQARSAAAWVCGKSKPNESTPWFWSDQYDLKLQLAGLSHGHDRCVLRGQPDQRSFCLFYLLGNRILAVDAVNRPADFMQVRRALGSSPTLQIEDPQALADESVSLKQLLGARS